MSTLLKVLAVAAIVLLDAAAVDAADCACDRLSAEGCRDDEAQLLDPPMGPPQWCERMDDPRCMPASPDGTSVQTLVPVAVGWAQAIRWNVPSRTGIPLDAWAEGGERAEHSRRVDRPPR